MNVVYPLISTALGASATKDYLNGENVTAGQKGAVLINMVYFKPSGGAVISPSIGLASSGWDDILDGRGLKPALKKMAGSVASFNLIHSLGAREVPNLPKAALLSAAVLTGGFLYSCAAKAGSVFLEYVNIMDQIGLNNMVPF